MATTYYPRSADSAAIEAWITAIEARTAARFAAEKRTKYVA